MGTYIRRTGSFNTGTGEDYEVFAVVDLRHLVSLTKSYISSYGEELTDLKMNNLIIDLLHATFTSYQSSDSHRWLRSFFNEGSEFIELFEKEASSTLNLVIPNWRDFEAECVHLVIEESISSTFIGFRKMFPNCNRNLLELSNDSDRFPLNKMKMIFEQEVLLDFSNSMSHTVDEAELDALSNGRISWAYLIEEITRISGIIRERNIFASQITVDTIVGLLDVTELTSRFENGDLYNRLILVEDSYACGILFDELLIDLAGLIARILYSNNEILNYIADQLALRARAHGYFANVSFHCVEVKWMNKAAIAKFGAFEVYPHSLFSQLGV